jgi:muramidase (phage lysozyme)
MSPLTSSCIQVVFESWSKLKLRLKVENFIKEYQDLIVISFASQMGMLGTHSTFRIHLAADSGHCN